MLAAHGLVKNDNSKLAAPEIKKLLDLVNESYRNIKFSVLPQILLELVIVEYCLDGKVATAPTPVVAVKTEEVKVEDKKQEVVFEEAKTEVVVEKEPVAAEVEVKTNSHGVLFNANKPEDFLHEFLMRLKQDNHSLAGVLRGCRLISINGSEVTFETRFKFHRDKLTEAKTSSILDKRASDILAENVHVVVNLVEK